MADTDKEKDSESDDIFSFKSSPGKINFFGIPVKLDLFNTIVGTVAIGAALGTGYLLYNDIQNKNLAEKAKKEQEQIRQMQYMRYLQEQERKRTALVRKPERGEEEEVETVPEPENRGLIDMSNFKQPSQEVNRMSYNELLTQAEQANPNNPTAYNYAPMNDYNAGFPSNNRTPPPSSPQERPMIDMSKLNNPNMDIIPQSSHPPASTPKVEEEEEDNQGSQTELEELYKSMNNYQ